MNTTHILAFLVALLAIPLVVFSQEQGDAARVVYSNVTIIDGTGAPPRTGMAIILGTERIHELVGMADLNVGNDVETVDATGWYAMPGLIDTHVHLATVPARDVIKTVLKRHVYGGITTVRDMAGDARALADLSRATLINDFPAPDVKFSALMAGPSFFDDPRTIASAMGMTPGDVPWMQAITDETDIRLAVAQARGTGATGIKIYANLPGHLVRRIIAESESQGIPVWTHAKVYPAIPQDSIEGGAVAVSHACMIADHAVEPDRQAYRRDKGNYDELDYSTITSDHPDVERILRSMAANNTIFDATLSVYARREAQSEEKEKAAPGCKLPLAAAITSRAVERGVRVSSGTDIQAEADDPWPSLYGELGLLSARAGMSNMQVLQAATLSGAVALGLEREIGSLEAGKFANIVFTTKDPLADIQNLKSVVLTVKRGQTFYRSEYQHEPIPEIPFPD